SPIAGDSGDGGPAAAAQLETPAAVLGPHDTILVVDDSANRVRLYDPAAGTIRAFAGTGEGGFGGDGGPATRALVNRPTGLAIDGGGNVHVAEHDNHIVRRIAADASGPTVPLAGDRTRGGGGDGWLALSASGTLPASCSPPAGPCSCRTSRASGSSSSTRPGTCSRSPGRGSRPARSTAPAETRRTISAMAGRRAGPRSPTRPASRSTPMARSWS